MSPSSNNLVQSSQSHRVPIPQAVLPSDEVKAEDIKHDILKEEQAENSSPHRSRYSQLLESDMPWFQEELSVRARVNPSCLESARLLKMYEIDIPHVMSSIRLSVLCPGSVPESQWERIFKGLPVDLGIFRSNLIRTTIDERPSTPISTASDWCMAWSYASKAIAFAFPNRASELQDYTDYILGLFVAQDESVHHNIIRYDMAVRCFVKGGHRTLFTDYQEFQHLWFAFMCPMGANYIPPKLAGKKRTRQEISE